MINNEHLIFNSLLFVTTTITPLFLCGDEYVEDRLASDWGLMEKN